MKTRRMLQLVLVLILAFGGGIAVLRAQQFAAPASYPEVEDADQKILAEISDHNEIMSNLEYLSDMIGQRLTGSANLKKANDWTRQRFADYGVANPHLEAWTIAHTWTRGTARGRIVSPAEHPLAIASYGWAPSTNGPVRGTVVFVSARTIEELDQYKGKLRGAIVITREPAELPPYDEPAQSPALRPYGAPFLLVSPQRPGQPAPPPRFGPEAQRFRRAQTDFFKSEGVAATLADSGKPDMLLNMTGLGGREYNISPTPAAFIASESYDLIWRLMKRGPVEVELEITNTIGDQPAEVYNTVAEIRGSEKPDEFVILGAHLDSWDLGNGTGSMVVLEAARALEKLGLQPKRTIRFVLFSGEEQGLNGSRAYVNAHKDDLPKTSGALIHDTGTGRVISISMMRNYQDREIMEKVLAPMRPLNLLELSQRYMTGSDHASFDEAGVPGFYCVQDPAQYFQTHHTQSDTFDMVHEADLVQGAQVMAAWAYNVAQLPDLLPRKPAPPAGASSAAN